MEVKFARHQQILFSNLKNNFLIIWLLAECYIILASRLFWTDGSLNHIESSDLNGRNRQILASDSDAFLNDIVISGEYLFYTAWHRQLVHSFIDILH